jgi:dolichol-phosphate mannosyltransferase
MRFPKRFAKFCMVGGSGVVVNEGLLFLLTEFAGLFYLISSIIAIEVSIITNFILNDYWTFNDKRKISKKHPFKRFFHWNFARLSTVAVNILFLWGLTTMGLHYLISNLIGIAVATFLAYAISVFWVWN